MTAGNPWIKRRQLLLGGAVAFFACAGLAQDDASLEPKTHNTLYKNSVTSQVGTPGTGPQFGAFGTTAAGPVPGTVATGEGAPWYNQPGHPRLTHQAVGSPFVLGSADFFFGDEITPPLFTLDGQPLSLAEARDYWRPQPVTPDEQVVTPNGVIIPVANDAPVNYHWSPHADPGDYGDDENYQGRADEEIEPRGMVFASNPGGVEIVWRTAESVNATTLQYGLRSEFYSVSRSSQKPVRNLFWTEDPQNGPKIQINRQLIKEVEVVYYDQVPELLDIELDPLSGIGPDSVKTVWYDGQASVSFLRAHNVEGKVLIEFRGAELEGQPGIRQHLGVEVVEISREQAPTPTETTLGEKVLPFPFDPSLLPQPVAGAIFEGSYYTSHVVEGETAYYATRENSDPNIVQFFWMERGHNDVRWPRQLNSYAFRWPGSPEEFDAQLVRPSDSSLSNQSFAQMPTENSGQLIHHDGLDAEAGIDFEQKLRIDLTASVDRANRSLLRFNSGNEFWYVRIHSSTDDQFALATETAHIGSRIQNPPGTDSVAGYIDTDQGGTLYNVGAYVDPFGDGGLERAETEGAIIPVNTLAGNDKLRVWWFKKLDPPVGSPFDPVYIPSVVTEYTLQWPGDAGEIVMASNQGTGELTGAEANGTIYFQNDPGANGYNANEEHALMLAGRGYALRDDLNRSTSSEPYVLIDYTDPNDDRPRMSVFEVLRENAEHHFEYHAVAGTQLQAPMPLPILPQPVEETINGDGETVRASRNKEVTNAAVDPPSGDSSETYEHYKRFTYEDRKGVKWVYRGLHDGTPTATGHALGMKFYYKTQSGFAFPDLAGQDQAPPLGTIVPYLRPRLNEVWQGDPVTGNVVPSDPPSAGDREGTQTIFYKPKWPEVVPELHFAETLALPKFGLPQVRGQRSLQIVYQQSLALDPAGTDDNATKSARLHDPTRQKTHAFIKNGDPEQGQLDQIPDSVATSLSGGKRFFPNLPTHLVDRLFFDAFLGDAGALVFRGEFVDEIAGEDYLLPNVLSAKDLEAAKDLCLISDRRKAAWDAALDALSTTLEKFVEDEQVPGTFIAEEPEEGEEEQTEGQFGPGESVEITDSDQAVDSYALTAVGGGEGYVTLIAGNGRAFTPEGEPVELHVFRVGGGLYSGELKPITGSNPLSENLTVQHTGDFAGEPGDYLFDWRKAPPVDGLAPPVYEHTHRPVPTFSFTESRLPKQASTGTDLGQHTFPIADLPINHSSIAFQPGVELSGDANLNLVASEQLSKVYIGLTLGAHDSVQLLVNDVTAIAYQTSGENTLPSDSIPSAVRSVMTGMAAIFELEPRLFNARLGSGQPPENITLALRSNAQSGTSAPLDFRMAISTVTDVTNTRWLSGITPTAGESGKNRHLVAGSGIDVLADNYYIMRYRAADTNHPSGGEWSQWTRPVLVEGWIKRVLAGINPFNQRLSDFYENAINTDVSLLTQAGTRFEGDIALNLDAVQDVGLIEIYETVLKRGVKLSIDGTPEVDYAPANDALLLAAGYLADLYTALGNEAFADASNPTISLDAQAVGTVADPVVAVDFESVFRSTATSRFAFKGQVASLIEEELALLRGRDDFLAPGIEISPVYNRMWWNYTRGIDAGEVIYALNYNITEKDGDDADGRIDATDAQRLFPQGHGDAYGHYLTALTNYYRLLIDDDFTWGNRSEAVNILGQPVSVDYLDERKFATAAAALARTGKQIQQLEHRRSYEKSRGGGWSHLDDSKENSRTGKIREWGFDDWSSRTGQGTYIHWVIANAILPAEDTVHEGIQKIDRSTVPELAEIAACGEEIQRQLDTANQGVNPLDLSEDSLLVDISPGELAEGKTHFEQIYDRAVRAVQNAASVFERAADSTRLLRSLENQNQELNAAVVDEERAFTVKLWDVYGVPYPGHTGPGKTYPQGYDGPDFFHYMYIDRPFEIFNKRSLFSYPEGRREFKLLVSNAEYNDLLSDPLGNLYSLPDEATSDAIPVTSPNGRAITITYPLQEDMGPYQLVTPEMDLGIRPSLGSLQDSLNAVRLEEEKYYRAVNGMEFARTVFIRDLVEFRKDFENQIAIQALETGVRTEKFTRDKLIVAIDQIDDLLDKAKEKNDDALKAAVDAVPGVVGLSNDISAPIRAVIHSAFITSDSILVGQQAGNKAFEATGDIIFEGVRFAANEAVIGLKEENSLRAKAVSLKDKYLKARGAWRDVDAQYVAYIRAQENFRNELCNGMVVQSQREVFRKRAAAVVQGYRTRDVAFRTFRTEALEQYQTLLDQAAKYTFLAAQAYDYETGLLGSEAGKQFLGKIVSSRALGVLDENGQPNFAASETGDPGLAGLLARMKADWDVIEGRLGFNNPDRNGTTFSLRKEFFRRPFNNAGNTAFKNDLEAFRSENLLEFPEIAAHALQIDSNLGETVPGFVIEFSTEVQPGLNFFGKPLAAGDHRFTESNFATKIRSVGVVFDGYKGMDPCLVCPVTGPGEDTSGHALALAATPHVYLIPAGTDQMRTPPLGDTGQIRAWHVQDYAVPLPYNIGNTAFSDTEYWTGRTSLPEQMFTARKHQAFRAVGFDEFFVSNRSDEYTNSRLVGRSVWNSKWLLVIPGRELLDSPEEGMRRFIESVTDIKLFIRSYSYSGN